MVGLKFLFLGIVILVAAVSAAQIPSSILKEKDKGNYQENVLHK